MSATEALQAEAAEGSETAASFENFTNDSAMMIAFERALETRKGDDALFQDPFAEKLAGSKGEALSKAFGANCAMFKFTDWPEFHKTWTAVRTRFIDDKIAEHVTSPTAFGQLVNLGAGLDTRAYRLEIYRNFRNGCFHADMASVNAGKQRILEDFLDSPTPFCKVCNVDMDFLDTETTLATELGKSGNNFDAEQPTFFVAEGLVMYLGVAGKLKLIRDVSAEAAPGSVFVLNFMEADKGAPQALLDSALSTEEATECFTEQGWGQLKFWKFGEEGLNFGRFPTDKFDPARAFSFVVAVKK